MKGQRDSKTHANSGCYEPFRRRDHRQDKINQAPKRCSYGLGRLGS